MYAIRSYYAVRLYYINFLQPKWGGSLDDIEKFIADLKPLYSQNKDLKDIEGRLPYTQGDVLLTTYDKDKVKLSIPRITSYNVCYTKLLRK